MNDAAAPGQFARKRMPIPPRADRGVRRQWGDFWLSVMFTLVRHVPGLVRASRGFFLWGAWRSSRDLREVTMINAARILGPQSTAAERAALGRQIIGSFYDFICDVGRTIDLPRAGLARLIGQVDGRDAYQQMRTGRLGAIIATAHMGSFELGMTAMLDIEKQVHVVFQRDANTVFERLRSDFRQRMGIIEAPADEGWGTWMKLRDALGRDEVVAIQADRAMPGQMGVAVPFLGGHAYFPEGPAKLAAITGAPIIPVFTVRQADGSVRIFIESAICVEAATEVAINEAIAKLADVIGRYVRQYPQQWLVLQRAWCEDMAEPDGHAGA